jgi:hypothetical protein
LSDILNRVKHEKLLRDFIVEAVIDASDRFKKKRADDTHAKIQSVYDAMPDAFAMQAAQEKEINARLNDLERVVDRHVSQKRARLAMPRVFIDDYDAGWGPEGSLFDIVAFTHRGARDHELVKGYVAANAEAFRRAAMDVDAELKNIEKDAEAMQWPAPWKRYTQWGSRVADVNRFIDNVAEFTRT